jgi:hypothetical protein
VLRRAQTRLEPLVDLGPVHQFWTVVSEIPKSFAICANDTSRSLAIATTSSRNSFGKGFGMLNILPAAIEITTRQESPQPSAVPFVVSLRMGYDVGRATLDAQVSGIELSV